MKHTLPLLQIPLLAAALLRGLGEFAKLQQWRLRDRMQQRAPR
jgi:hypothetical protein